MTVRLLALGRFAYDFVVGDDWRIAVAVALGLTATYAVAHAGTAAWWIVPTLIGVGLPLSLWAAVRRRRQ